MKMCFPCEHVAHQTAVSSAQIGKILEEVLNAAW